MSCSNWGLSLLLDTSTCRVHDEGMWQRLSKWLVGLAAGEFLRTWIWPFLASGAGVVTGLVEAIPFTYILVAATLMFSSTMGGVLWFEQTRDRHRTKDKLVFLSVRGTILSEEDSSIKAMRFGFDLRNIGNMPIRFRIDDMKTSVIPRDKQHDPCYPPNKEYETRELTIPASCMGWFQDHKIPLPKGLRGHAEARMDCRGSYGKNFEHVLAIKKKAFFFLMDEGITGGTDWYDH